jgi:protease-4
MLEQEPISQNQPGFAWLRLLANVFFLGLLPIGLGMLLARGMVQKPAVGVIRLNVDIWSTSAEYIRQQVDEARLDKRIRAVVVQIESPGGEVVATQNIYMALQDLRREIPVVGSIDGIAASGGFYAAMATDPIYARPSSSVGNVGVWSYFPVTPGVDDLILASGPFKLSASNYDEFLRELEGIRQEFVGTVVSQRGDRLKISPLELSQGLLYPGREALAHGLVDAIGSQKEAMDRAAEMAGIADYDVIDLGELVLEKYYGAQGAYLPTWSGAADLFSGVRRLPPGIYLLNDVLLERAP